MQFYSQFLVAYSSVFENGAQIIGVTRDLERDRLIDDLRFDCGEERRLDGECCIPASRVVLATIVLVQTEPDNDKVLNEQWEVNRQFVQSLCICMCTG